MSPAAFTTACSICRLPITGPQRPVIAACAVSNEPRAASSAASRARAWECRERRQRQGGIGRIDVARSRAAPGAPGHLHRAEQRGQEPAMAGLQPGPRDPVRTHRRGALLPRAVLFSRRPQVQVVLQQLPLHLPPPGEELFDFTGGQPGRLGALQLSDQRGEQIHRGGKGASTRDRGIRFHRALLPARFVRLAPSNLGRRARYHPGFDDSSPVPLRAGANSPGPVSSASTRSGRDRRIVGRRPAASSAARPGRRSRRGRFAPAPLSREPVIPQVAHLLVDADQPVIQPGLLQCGADPDRLFLDVLGDPVRARPGPSAARLKSRGLPLLERPSPDRVEGLPWRWRARGRTCSPRPAAHPVATARSRDGHEDQPGRSGPCLKHRGEVSPPKGPEAAPIY